MFDDFRDLSLVDSGISLARSLSPQSFSTCPACASSQAAGQVKCLLEAQGSNRPKAKLLVPTEAGLDLAEHHLCLTLSPKAVTHWMDWNVKIFENTFEVTQIIV